MIHLIIHLNLNHPWMERVTRILLRCLGRGASWPTTIALAAVSGVAGTVPEGLEKRDSPCQDPLRTRPLFHPSARFFSLSTTDQQ